MQVFTEFQLFIHLCTYVDRPDDNWVENLVLEVATDDTNEESGNRIFEYIIGDEDLTVAGNRNTVDELDLIQNNSILPQLTIKLD